ncbi:hypothetical protein ACFSBF_16550 [Sphingobacterium suaedae]|uniref:Uncharacterized protein n=2 Tax=Sphingobacterium suaedae TaxID=1686402 RepID=A0ABW5KK52_9SPHI
MDIIDLKKEVWEYFLPYFSYDGNTMEFNYARSGTISEKEFWKDDVLECPSTTAIWLASDTAPELASHLFLGYSARDILSFAHFCTDWLIGSQSVAFAALGMLPSRIQIDWFRLKFPNAKVHALFGTDIIGRIADCKVALWLHQSDAEFRLVDDYLMVNGKLSFTMLCDQFSFDRFKRKYRLHSQMRTHKPTYPLGTYGDYFSILDKS